ncbi:glycosyltransferase [Actinoplanes sp. RD1]|uniref:glycosyltransferase n=1 Tax=Actinoplanes sp. RD1 TaxID=3064538 RepID=UPI002740EBB5|nr:glycosyltransferase [Actinoplanes sp. RD1]
MRIVRLANFVTERSGGLRTALRELGTGYRLAGHDPVLIHPGVSYTSTETEQGLVITLPGPEVPGMGGYRVLLDRRRLADTLRGLRPDHLEVSDRSTLRWVGRWARRYGIPSTMVSHESLDGLLRLLGPFGRLADRLNARTAAEFDRIVATTSWAAAEFERLGVRDVVRVPLGVDLDRFHPSLHDPLLRRHWAAPRDVLLVHCGRLSAEKSPGLSLDAVEALRASGVPAVLVIAGGGPLRPQLQASAAARGLPARFIGHVGNRQRVAALLATADVVLAPGPVETFGLSALEALASGTPTVVHARSALPEVVGGAGLGAVDGESFARAAVELLARPDRRTAARARASMFPWSASVNGFLSVIEGARAGASRQS